MAKASFKLRFSKGWAVGGTDNLFKQFNNCVNAFRAPDLSYSKWKEASFSVKRKKVLGSTREKNFLGDDYFTSIEFTFRKKIDVKRYENFGVLQTKDVEKK